MAFSVSARTILELGKELISSDEVAIYELIKNGIDATRSIRVEHLREKLDAPSEAGPSPKITLSASIVLTLEAYRAAVDQLEANASPDKILASLRAACIKQATLAKVDEFMTLLQGSVEDREGFAKALQSNYEEKNILAVEDCGEGMSLIDLEKVYLRIGTGSRRRENASGSAYLGDKGVGRLSAMRLGDRLRVVTGKVGEAFWNVLEIDWRRFSDNVDDDLSDIAISPRRGEPKAEGLHGTTIEVRALSGDWDAARFKEMLQGPIARMFDPFQAGRANDLLQVRYNGGSVLIPSIPAALLASAHATAIGSFRIEVENQEDGSVPREMPSMTGTVNYALRNASTAINQRGAEIFSLAERYIKRRAKKGHAAAKTVPLRLQALKDLGPFEFEIYWFNRAVVDAVATLSANQRETRAKIAEWSGGPMLFRNGFRILPYGDPNDDWLALDLNAFGLAGFKLNRQQVIGRVTVHSAHAALGEQTNREGLVRSDAADALRTMLTWILHVEMRSLINQADDVETINKRMADEGVQKLEVERSKVQAAVDALRGVATPTLGPIVSRVATTVDGLADQCAKMSSGLKKAVEEAVDEREKFVHLAGIGLMTEFIFHELNRSVEHTLRVLSEARSSQKQAAMQALEDQLRTLQKRIAAFDELSGEKRQTRSKFDIRDVVATILESHGAELERHQIVVELSMPDEFGVNAVRGMAVQIIENILANAVYWLKRQVLAEPGFLPQIHISLNPKDRTLSIEDNGPGVDPDRAERIFQPFVTSKPANEGRGLGLYISREMATYNKWRLSMDDAIGRKRSKRINMFVLSMAP